VAKLFGIKLSGFPAWFLFRTVYLLKMPGVARKVRVALDWTIDLVFTKDTVQLGLSRARSGIGGVGSARLPAAGD
jgi:NADH dehydrogenase